MGSAAAQLCRPTNRLRALIAALPGTNRAPRPARIAATPCLRRNRAMPHPIIPRDNSRATVRRTILPRTTPSRHSIRPLRLGTRASPRKAIRPPWLRSLCATGATRGRAWHDAQALWPDIHPPGGAARVAGAAAWSSAGSGAPCPGCGRSRCRSARPFGAVRRRHAGGRLESDFHRQPVAEDRRLPPGQDRCRLHAGPHAASEPQRPQRRQDTIRQTGEVVQRRAKPGPIG